MRHLISALCLCVLGLSGCATASRQHVATTSPTASPAAVTGTARAALSAGQFETADALFRSAVKSNPNDAEAQLGAGEAALGIGKADDALVAFQAAARAPAYRAQALAGEGNAYLAQRKPDDAVAAFAQSVESNPHLVAAWISLARLRAGGSQEKANAVLEAALDANKGSAELRNEYGLALLNQHRYAAARDAFIAALDCDPALIEAQGNLRLAYAWQGDYDRALMHAPDAERPQVLNNIGYVAMLRGDLKRAEMLLTNAQNSSPTYYKKAVDNLRALRGRTNDDAP